MIYCIEDDNSIRELMLYTLRISGFEAEGFETATEALNALNTLSPDLILLDIMLPGMDGLELLRHLRKTTQIPVIMATAKGTEYDKVTGLDAGADDYLVKPFSMIEMVSRVRNEFDAVTRNMDEGLVLLNSSCYAHYHGPEHRYVYHCHHLLLRHQ